MSGHVRCPTCFHEARWDAEGAVIEELVEGGVRRPAPHPNLAAFRVWARSRAGELGPVVGACPHCAMPVVLEEGELPADAPWTLDTPLGPYIVGADVLRGPKGPLDVASAEVVLSELYQPRATDQLGDPRLVFLLVVGAIIAAIAVVWLGAFLFVANFLYAMGTQGNFAAPFQPGM